MIHATTYSVAHFLFSQTNARCLINISRGRQKNTRAKRRRMSENNKSVRNNATAHTITPRYAILQQQARSTLMAT